MTPPVDSSREKEDVPPLSPETAPPPKPQSKTEKFFRGVISGAGKLKKEIKESALLEGIKEFNLLKEIKEITLPKGLQRLVSCRRVSEEELEEDLEEVRQLEAEHSASRLSRNFTKKPERKVTSVRGNLKPPEPLISPEPVDQNGGVLQEEKSNDELESEPTSETRLQKAERKVSEIKEEFEEKVTEIKEKVTEIKAEIKEKVEEIKEKVEETATEFQAGVRRLCSCLNPLCCCCLSPKTDPIDLESPDLPKKSFPRPIIDEPEPIIEPEPPPEPIDPPERDSATGRIEFFLPRVNFPQKKYEDWLSKRAVVAYQQGSLSYSNFKTFQLMAFFEKMPFFFSDDQTEFYLEIKRSFYGFIRRVFLRQTLGRSRDFSEGKNLRTVLKHIALHEGIFNKQTTRKPHRPVSQESQPRLRYHITPSVKAVVTIRRRLRTRQVANKRGLGRSRFIQSVRGSQTYRQVSGLSPHLNEVNEKEVSEWIDKSTQMKQDSFLVNFVKEISYPDAKFSPHEEDVPTFILPLGVPTFSVPNKPEEFSEITSRSIHRDTDETLLEKCISSVKGKQEGRIELGAMFQIFPGGLIQAFPSNKQSIWSAILFVMIPYGWMRSISTVLTSRLFGLTGPLRMQPEKGLGEVNISCVRSLKGGRAIVWDPKTGVLIVGGCNHSIPVFASRPEDYFLGIC